MGSAVDRSPTRLGLTTGLGVKWHYRRQKIGPFLSRRLKHRQRRLANPCLPYAHQRHRRERKPHDLAVTCGFGQSAACSRAGSASACGSNHGSRPPIKVAVDTMTPAPVTRPLAVSGRIAALHSVEVRALVSGTLVDLSVSEGDSIGHGT